MNGFLLDTNHIIPLLRGKDEDQAAILAHLATAPAKAPVCIATATLAEMEVGCCLGLNGRSEAQAEIRETLWANGLTVLNFTNHTAAEYGALKAALMKKYNREGLRNAAKWPEDWTSPDKGKTVGVDEFDLLVVSHALERRLVLVTTDSMRRICEGIGDAAASLDFANWIPESTAGT